VVSREPHHIHFECGHILNIKSPGVLSVDTDAAAILLRLRCRQGMPQCHQQANAYSDPNGGFDASVPCGGTYTFTYKAQNSQGTLSVSVATVTLIFLTPSHLTVTVLTARHPKSRLSLDN